MMINKVVGNNLLTSSKMDCASKEGSTEKIAVVPLQSQHIEDTARVLVKSFLDANNLYQDLDLDHEKFLTFMRNKCQDVVNKVNKDKNYPTSYVLLNNGKVMGAIIMREVTNYVQNLDNNLSGIKSYDAYLHFNRSFWEDVGPQFKEGQAVYGDMIGVDPDAENKGYAFMLTDAVASEGFKKRKFLISRITNQKLLRLTIKYRHAEILKQFKMLVSGAPHTFWMIGINFQKLRNRPKENEKSKL